METDGVSLSLFASRVTAICDEMGAVLRRAAFSPNIKDRLDFSCALFDRDGELFAQAAHIPVHLGSMAYAMRDLVKAIDWQENDLLAVNDPYLGGTHLPDVTLISPVFVPQQAEPIAFVANRAHHADIGCETPGSMPVSSVLEEEGLIIPPTLLSRAGVLQEAAYKLPGSSDRGLSGDFAAQAGAVELGVKRLQSRIASEGLEQFQAALLALNDYGDRLMAIALARLRPGNYSFSDYLDDDGYGSQDIELKLTLQVSAAKADKPDCTVNLDFTESADQVPGNLNCPESVVAAAVYYSFRCLLPDSAPSCHGLFRRLKFRVRAGSVLNARRPAAVAAGNVETSTRLVDVIMGALAQAAPDRIPAASQGTMNNVAMGRVKNSEERWDYYETLAGGGGASPRSAGLSGAHSHMTNTLNTPAESVEMHYPLRIRRYELRSGSGGNGEHRGGHGIVREYEFLEPAELSLLTERRRYRPWGLAGGEAGQSGLNLLNDQPVPGKLRCDVNAGDRLTVLTPGGGGWGEQPRSADTEDG